MPCNRDIILGLLYYQYAFLLISLQICGMICQIINHERDEIINLKFLKIQQKRSKRENSTGPNGAP